MSDLSLIEYKLKLQEEKEKLKDLEYQYKYNPLNLNKQFLEDKVTNQKEVIEDLEKKLLPKTTKGFNVKTKSSGNHKKRKRTKKRKHKKRKTKKRKTKKR